MKNFNDTIGNRTRDLPTYSTQKGSKFLTYVGTYLPVCTVSHAALKPQILHSNRAVFLDLNLRVLTEFL